MFKTNYFFKLFVKILVQNFEPKLVENLQCVLFHVYNRAVR